MKRIRTAMAEAAAIMLRRITGPEIFMFLHVVDLVGDGCNGMVVW